MAMAGNEDNKTANNDLSASGRSAVSRDLFHLLLEIESHFRAEDRKNTPLKRVPSRPNARRTIGPAQKDHHNLCPQGDKT
jgi:hypothetical protein